MDNNDKIKKLTDKIYLEGIEKAKEDAQLIIDQSNKEAAKIIDDAAKEAKRILNKAEKEALNTAERIMTELRLSSQQSLAVLRKEITELIQTKVFKEPLQNTFEDHEFMKEVLEMVIKKWNPNNGDSELDVILPKEKVEDTERFIKKRINGILNNGLSFQGNDSLKNGFEILSRNGNYKITITDTAFEAFIKAHFKDNIIEFLFKEEK